MTDALSSFRTPADPVDPIDPVTAAPASRTTRHTVAVQFGDCDPAGIVFFSNFLRWMDAASLSFFAQCGVPPWRVLGPQRGIVGTPLLEINTRFLQSATYGETLVISTHVAQWNVKTFVQVHRIHREGTLLCEGREVRVFARKDTDHPDRLRAIPVPPDIVALCAEPPPALPHNPTDGTPDVPHP